MKKICLVSDIPGWAFDIIAHKIKSSLGKEFIIDIDYFDVREKADSFFEFLESKKEYDMIHFFWRKTLLQIESETFKNKVLSKYESLEKYIEEISSKLSTGVYDFLFLKPEEIIEYKNVFNRYVKNYYVISKKLLKEYEKIDEYRKPYGVVHDIFDDAKMIPQNLERFDEFDRPLVIGWVGNSKFNFDGVDLKGFNSILKLTIAELILEGYKIEEFYADRNIVWRTHEEMPEYYSKIDICICLSIMEGTPLPILEAMSCGVPIISTDVGVVREAIRTKRL